MQHTVKLVSIAAAALLAAGCASHASQPDKAAQMDKPKPPPRGQAVLLKANVQTFAPGESALNDAGKKEIDKLVNLVNKGTKRDSRPTHVGAVVVAGHVDTSEEQGGAKMLAEERAKAVKDYLVSKGIHPALVFYEAKGARAPMPVTKFCDAKLPRDELMSCLQPNRRVEVELSGTKPKKAKKKKS